MDLKEYQKRARKTAIYPNMGANFAYVALGLADETGELLEKVDDGADEKEIIKELGDQWWYTSQIAEEIGSELCLLVGKDPLEVDVYESDTVLRAMIINAAQIAGKAKKAIRDDEGLITESRKDDIETLLYSQVVLLNIFAGKLNVTSGEVRQLNLDKLEDRKERGVLKGSGDNR